MAIKGLDELIRGVGELEKAMAALDGDIASVNFNPNDPQSIEAAIQQTEAAIDERVGGYGQNEMVQKIVTELKEKSRQSILERAAVSRAEEEPQ